MRTDLLNPVLTSAPLMATLAWVGVGCRALGPSIAQAVDSTYAYERSDSVSEVELSRTERDGVTVIDLRFLGPDGDSVPAFLVQPPGAGPWPLVIFAHWMMPGSPLKNRTEFLEEAVVLSAAGAVALLPDEPQVRPGFAPAQEPLEEMLQSAEASRRMILDVRRAIDLLSRRGLVDTTRIAFVGHSFGAHVGGILTAIEKRIGAFVLMAGGFADEDYVFDDSLPNMLAFRSTVDDSALRAFYLATAWDDPVHFVGRSGPAVVLLQFGSRDAGIPPRLARRYTTLFGQPNEARFYDAGHELNPHARMERVLWLADRLRLAAPDTGALGRIPPLR